MSPLNFLLSDTHSETKYVYLSINPFQDVPKDKQVTGLRMVVPVGWTVTGHMVKICKHVRHKLFPKA